MNDTTKHVVSATLEQAAWQNTQIAGPYDAGVIGQLKERVPGGIYVSGSGTLVRAMLADGLVDELHLFLYPLTAGAGPGCSTGRRLGSSRWPTARPTTTACSTSTMTWRRDQAGAPPVAARPPGPTAGFARRARAQPGGKQPPVRGAETRRVAA